MESRSWVALTPFSTVFIASLSAWVLNPTRRA
jgi:hypothetical protein